MAALFGHIGEFIEGQEEWPQYVERLEHFLAANGIVEADKKRDIFLSVIGPKAYKLLKSLVAPAKPGEKSCAELVAVMTQHHSPPPSEIVQRYRFHTRFRRQGETVATYVSELRALAQLCNFGETLNDMLRDRLVCGVNEETVQRRLLAEPALTLKKALEIAQGLEAAARNVREIRAKPGELGATAGRPQTEEVHEVSRQGSSVCFRCGKDSHRAAQCPFRTAKCHNCGKVGHIKRACRSRKPSQQTWKPIRQGQQQRPKPIQVVQEGGRDSTERLNEYSLYHIGSGQSSKPLQVEVLINGQVLVMEVDTGAAVTLVSEKTFHSKWSDVPLQPSSINLRTYSREPLPVVGQADVHVQYGEQEMQLPLIVVGKEGPSLFGRDWLAKIRLDWRKIHMVQGSTLTSVLDRHSRVFEEGLGTLQGYEAQLHVDSEATPRFCKTRTVPYAMRTKVEQELDRLVTEGIVEPVQYADWAAPIVPVLKSDGRSVRICGDFRLTVNQASKLDRYPIPKIEDLFASLSGGNAFTKLDLSQAYQQVPLAEESRKYVVINTHRGLFQYNRLPYGVSSAPGVFQRVMDGLLKGIPGVIVYLDDILITGKTEQEHLAALEEVLQRLGEAGLRVQKSKCTFMAPSVTYLGHCIDSLGLHPIVEKVQAIQDAPEPRNQSELKSYLGLLSYYSRFLPNLPTTLAPLYQRLRRSVPWSWGASERKSFQASKKLLVSSKVLVHFDPQQEIVLACDASAYGIGAVLSHKMPDGSEKPIGFASRTLTDTERKYAQIEKEGLACVFGVTRFHSYLFGHHFTLITDNKALMSLFDSNRPISPQASGRIQRWALKLAMYEYSLSFRPTTQHANADALSRLPLPKKPDFVPIPAELVLLTEHLAEAPLSAAQLKTWTAKDPLLVRVLHFIREGWPNQTTEEFKPYFTKRLELTELDGCIVWCGRVLIPVPGRKHILAELHGGHPGGSRMKALARLYVWWPGMDRNIEETVQHCEECQQTRPSPAAPLHPWQWPTRPWARIHIDFAGPLENRMYLIIIDAHSKWIEVYPMTSTTATNTIQILRTTFARFGIPESVVSDNGPQFTSTEFQQFCKSNGIRQILVAAYHPSSNGLAERAVRLFKEGFGKMSDGSVEDRIARFLFSYRITPQSTTQLSPAELLFGRRLRSRFDLLKPNLSQRVENKQKKSHDKRVKQRTFQEGEEVYAKNFRPFGKKWLPGKVIKCTGPVSVRVELTGGVVVRRHYDQIRSRSTHELAEKQPLQELVMPPMADSGKSVGASVTDSMESTDLPERPQSRDLPSSPVSKQSNSQPPVTVPQEHESPRYPTRVRRPPDRLEL